MTVRFLIAILVVVELGTTPTVDAGSRGERGASTTERGLTVLATATERYGSAETEADDDDGDGRYCSLTTSLMFHGCKAEVSDDFFNAQANCIQVLDSAVRNECFAEARSQRRETDQRCGEQRAARRNLCEGVGEERYDPEFDPALFIDDYTSFTPNPYYPLVIGYRWEFEAAHESNVIEVLAKTKRIEDVTCIVISDLVIKQGGGEKTDDWYAQRLDGSVSYCGEAVEDFEIFAGDIPPEPELVAIDGSFKHGRDGALAGLIMPATPVFGQVYRQEMSLGNAEDAAVILSTTYRYGEDAELDAFVPQELAELLCAGDCIVTGESTPIEPDLFARKFYAHGIGLFLEVDLESGEINSW